HADEVTVCVFRLDPIIEEILRASIHETPACGVLALEPGVAHDIVAAAARATTVRPGRAVVPPTAHTRLHVRALLQPEHPRLPVQGDHSSPRVAVVSAYSVGSIQDPKGREGLAHFIEHLAFRTHFADDQPVWNHLKRMGAEFNAFTQWDFTVYYTVVPKAE